MIGPRTEFTIDAVAQTPLHIGSGETAAIERNTPKGPHKVELALVAADGEGAPILPGASVKGVLRAMAAGRSGTIGLFGKETKENADKPVAGRLICWTGRLAEPHPNMLNAPMAGDPLPGRNKSFGSVATFVDARTAIDPETGAAHEHRLFHRRMVAKGARFRLVFAAQFARDPAEAAQERNLLCALIAEAASDAGVTIGGGSGGGQGLMRFDLKTLEVVERGIKDAPDATAKWRQAIGWAGGKVANAVTLTLHKCDAFISNDTTNVDHQQKGSPKLRYLREPGTDLPRLSGTTVRGALRARAVWLARLSKPAHRDNRDLILDPAGETDADLTKPRARCADPAKLSSTERLFGVNGWRGLLRVVSTRCLKSGGPVEITSVKLDRFSGGPMHGALFSLEAAMGPEFEVVLTLTDRAGARRAEDKALYCELLEDLKEDGLMLGLGTNKGYGWFDVR